MSNLLADHALVDVRRESLWALLEDPRALARVLPGAESVVSVAPGRFRCVLSTRLQFLTIRADVNAAIVDPEPPHRLRLELDGRPQGLAGSFRVAIDVEMTPADGPKGVASMTTIDYGVDLGVTGRLASFGAPLLRETMRRQISLLVANVEREIADPGATEVLPS